RVAALTGKVRVLVAPERAGRLDLRWLLRSLGGEQVTALLGEGGGEGNASFLLGGLAQRGAFFYSPKILCGRGARKSVGGEGVRRVADMVRLGGIDWRWLGPDLLLTGEVLSPQG